MTWRLCWQDDMESMFWINEVVNFFSYAEPVSADSYHNHAFTRRRCITCMLQTFGHLTSTSFIVRQSVYLCPDQQPYTQTATLTHPLPTTQYTACNSEFQSTLPCMRLNIPNELFILQVFFALLLLIRVEFTGDTCPNPPKEEHEYPHESLEFGDMKICSSKIESIV